MPSYDELHEIVKETISNCRETVAHSRMLVELARTNCREVQESLKELRDKVASRDSDSEY
jgi:hypothetical protein